MFQTPAFGVWIQLAHGSVKPIFKNNKNNDMTILMPNTYVLYYLIMRDRLIHCLMKGSFRELDNGERRELLRPGKSDDERMGGQVG